MARIRKEKGVRRGTKDLSRSIQDVGKKSEISKQQVIALGGDEYDYDLVKDVEDAGSGEEDPALSKDVSKFLKELKLDGTQLDSSDVQRVDKVSKRGGTTSKPFVSVHAKQPKLNNAESSNVSEQTPVVKPVKPAAPESKRPKSNFVVEPTSQWYIALPALPPPTAPTPALTAAKLVSLTTHAATLHANTIATYQSQSSSTATNTTSDFSFLQKILQGGTLSDRLSALTLLVQSSPVHNLKALETLKGMAERGKGKGGREESLKALRCVVDWWVGGGAPSRKLKYFRDQHLMHPFLTDQHLLLWYFEDWLKKYFFSILQILETLSLDPLPYVRTQALSLIFTLLRDKPEQEHNLLRLLVNKLGDTEKSLCSRASYHLLQLAQSHPSMKTIIVREITSLVLRPPAPTASLTSSSTHIRFNDATSSSSAAKVSKPKKETNVHARYYATITYNQIVLAPGDREVALQLINVYFEIFKELLGEGSSNDKVGGADDDATNEKGGGKQKSKGKEEGRKGYVKTKAKAKAKEVKGEAGFAEVEDEHSKLISAILTGVNRALPFAKISSADVILNKHVDTLFLVTHTSTFNISLQALLLIQQIASSVSSSSLARSITDRYYRTLYASLHDPRLASSSKQAMYLNLLFKSLKSDEDKERVKAFVRRFVQVLVSGGGGATEFVAGGLYLLGELFNTVPGLRAMLDAPPLSADTDGEYDPRKREPQFAHASSSAVWEFIPLAHHYHPTVSLHARQLLSSKFLTASADLSLNTLSHFLDRFVYKNPKKSAKHKGSSVMQPAASGLDSTGVKLLKGEVLSGALAPVNGEKFWKKRAEEVPVDELFFHKFFSQKNEKERAKAAKVDKRKDHDDSTSSSDWALDDHKHELQESDGEVSDAEINVPEEAEEDSDADEAEIWKVMQATMPKEAGDSDLMDDNENDDPPSGLDDDDDDDDDDVGLDASLNSSDEDEDEMQQEDADVLALAEGSDNDDLINLDEDLPGGLIDYDVSDSETAPNDQEWTGLDGGQKRKRGGEKRAQGKRKKLRSLPTFASYEDYAKMIDEGPEDDI